LIRCPAASLIPSAWIPLMTRFRESHFKTRHSFNVGTSPRNSVVLLKRFIIVSARWPNVRRSTLYDEFPTEPLEDPNFTSNRPVHFAAPDGSAALSSNSSYRTVLVVTRCVGALFVSSLAKVYSTFCYRWLWWWVQIIGAYIRGLWT
jgi:hypothetical protein